MRVLLTLAAWISILSFARPCAADEIRLKDGRSVEWRSLSDNGDSYDVETAGGARITVAKADIVDIVRVVKSSVPLSGATYTLDGKTKTLDCLKIMDVGRFEGFGVWKISDGRLSFDAVVENPSMLPIPMSAPEEFDLFCVVERKAGISPFVVGLVGGGKQFLLVVDGDKCSKTGLSDISGKGFSDNETSSRGHRLPTERRVALACAIRKDRVVVTADKKEIVNWKADWGKVTLPASYALADGKARVFLASFRVVGTTENLFHVHRLSVTADFPK